MSLKDLNKMGFGLNPTPIDKKDYSYKRVFGTPLALPTSDFMVAEPFEIENQFQTDYCAAYASSTVSELQEGVDLDPIFSFAAIKSIDGNPQGWGADLRSACKAAVKIGFIEKKDAVYDVNDTREKIVYLTNYPTDLVGKALKYRKESYFKIDVGFDGVRAILWANRAKKQAIFTGVIWREGWTEAENGIIPNFPSAPYFGHAIAIAGQKFINSEPCLVAVLSNGKSIGEKGLFYFSKEVFERDFTFGCFIFNDMPQDQARREAWPLWRRLIEWLKKLF